MSAVEDLLGFLDSAPSPHLAVRRVAERLGAAGIESQDYRTVEPSFFSSPQGALRHGGSIVAWRWPVACDVRDGATIVGAHTDSPCLRLKPRPDARGAGLSLLEVEIYGGALLNSWLDRDLGVAGVVHLADGASRFVHDARPLARIPQLAIHLDRDVNEKGLVLNRQNHMRPIWAVDSEDVLPVLLQADARHVVAHELVLFDVNPASLVGFGDRMIASGRLDNLVSCWAATEALASHTGPRPLIVCLFDHEEVGSQSNVGAAGPLLETVLDQLLHCRSATTHRFEFLRASLCISTDNAHALHPNYPDRHDSGHAPFVNKGPAIKTNANQRYATSAHGASHVRSMAAHAGIPLQEFVSNNSMPCGSTIGPITATRLGVETIDIGVPQLAMHSARETCGVDDPVHLRNLISAIAEARFA